MTDQEYPPPNQIPVNLIPPIPTAAEQSSVTAQQQPYQQLYQQPQLQQQHLHQGNPQFHISSDQVYPTPPPEQIAPAQQLHQQHIQGQSAYQVPVHSAQPGGQNQQHSAPDPQTQQATQAPYHQQTPQNMQNQYYQQNSQSPQNPQNPQNMYYQQTPQNQFNQQSTLNPQYQNSQYPSYQQPTNQYPYYQQQQWQQANSGVPSSNRFGLYLTLAILEALFCGGIFAFPAIVYAVLMNGAYKHGYGALYIRQRKTCRIWLIVAFCIGLVANIMYATMLFST